MRAFFWVKFRQTGDETWKRMAITKKTAFRIPPRLGLRAAAARVQDDLDREAERLLRQYADSFFA